MLLHVVTIIMHHDRPFDTTLLRVLCNVRVYSIYRVIAFDGASADENVDDDAPKRLRKNNSIG